MAAGAKIWLRKILNYLSKKLFKLLLQFNFFLNAQSFRAAFLRIFLYLGAFQLSGPVLVMVSNSSLVSGRGSHSRT